MRINKYKNQTHFNKMIKSLTNSPKLDFDNDLTLLTHFLIKLQYLLTSNIKKSNN
jgi:hypothetical protein